MQRNTRATSANKAFQGEPPALLVIEGADNWDFPGGKNIPCASPTLILEEEILVERHTITTRGILQSNALLQNLHSYLHPSGAQNYCNTQKPF